MKPFVIFALFACGLLFWIISVGRSAAPEEEMMMEVVQSPLEGERPVQASTQAQAAPEAPAESGGAGAPPSEAVSGRVRQPGQLTPPTLTSDLDLLHPTFFPVRENFETFAQPLQDALDATWDDLAEVWPDHYYGDQSRSGERIGDLLGPLDLDYVWRQAGVQRDYADFMLAFTVQVRLKALEQNGSKPHPLLLEAFKEDLRNLALKIWAHHPHGEFLYEAGQRLRGRK